MSSISITNSFAEKEIESHNFNLVAGEPHLTYHKKVLSNMSFPIELTYFGIC